jgi:hypothetical protein
MINVENLKPFPKFCYTIGMIPSSYKESLTYEEQLWWFCDFLQNTVIPTVNNNGMAVQELQNLYVQLKNYVDNYFENLDVQTEINNKLDQMVENGTLQKIITDYLQINGVLAFNTVNDMQNATNLINGSFTQTFGFYTLNDGGGAKYKIRTITNDDIVDNKFIISLNDKTLIAELIYNNEINTLQIGLKNDNSEDISQTINNIISNNTKIQKINFNKGNYKVSNTININRKITLNLNNSILNFDGTNYLFNITTHYNNKPTIINGTIKGTNENNFINATEGQNNWGVSFDLINCRIEYFNIIYNCENIFNSITNNVDFISDGKFIYDAYDMSNANAFVNCYFHSPTVNSENYPQYKFIMDKTKNMLFQNCSFEQYITLFNNTNCHDIVLSNCEIEQSSYIGKNSNGLILTETNAFFDFTKLFENDDYKSINSKPLKSFYYWTDDDSTGNLRSKIRNSNNKNDFITTVANASGNSSVRLIDFSNNNWKLHIPFNIVRNSGTGNITELSTDVATPIFNFQQNESHILTIYNILIGSDTDTQCWKSERIQYNYNTFAMLSEPELTREVVWTNSSLKDNVITENLDINNYVVTTTKPCAEIHTIIKFEPLGDKIRN